MIEPIGDETIVNQQQQQQPMKKKFFKSENNAKKTVNSVSKQNRINKKKYNRTNRNTSTHIQ
ncbi:hypothetical protein DERF_005950 [Dermatophagoides farinae]|uniref:Uncharacterized protein n=1 Tax=Dermatophagoides farinae TaxID=6954 RepID=A0A922L6P6_DERFA|nr:hypothetical protein DERF_005950 [Dermatophagoides farinae]